MGRASTANGEKRFDVLRRGSSAVQALEAAWNFLRKVQPEIPPAVLTLVDVRSRGSLRGYFAHSTWKKRRGSSHEIAISPSLIGKPTELLATMLHEAAHAVLFDLGKNGGMGSTAYYHTKAFRDQCVAFGLECGFRNTRYGWTLTAFPSSGAPERYSLVVKLLKRKLPAGVGGKARGRIKGRKLPPPGHTMLVCACEDEYRTVYVKKSVLEKGGVFCAFCNQAFRRSD